MILFRKSVLKFFFGILLFLFIDISLSAQIIDSLKTALKSAKEDTNKVIMYDDVVWEYIYSEPENAIVYATKALELSQKLNWKPGIAIAENSSGIYYNSQGDFSNTLIHFLNALKLREELNDKKGLATYFISVGFIYDNQGQVEKALDSLS